MANLDETRTAPATPSGNAPAGDAARGSAEAPANEIVESAKRAKEGEEKASAGDNRAAWIAAGVGVGIGSAALVAALLYANRDKGKARKKS